jgi:hypothetical protein
MQCSRMSMLCFSVPSIAPFSTMALSKTFLFAFLLPVLLAIAAYSLHFHTQPVLPARSTSTNRHRSSHQIPSDGSVKSLNASVTFISAELKKAYPKHIHPNTEWITNLAGGFKTAMLILHASCYRSNETINKQHFTIFFPIFFSSGF